MSYGSDSNLPELKLYDSLIKEFGGYAVNLKYGHNPEIQTDRPIAEINFGRSLPCANAHRTQTHAGDPCR